MADAEGAAPRASLKRKAEDTEGPDSKKLKAGTTLDFVLDYTSPFFIARH